MLLHSFKQSTEGYARFLNLANVINLTRDITHITPQNSFKTSQKI